MKNFVARCREWQKNHSKWALICDIDDVDALYLGWIELPKKERMHWIGTYGASAEEAWEEFGIKRCKVAKRILDCNMELHKIEDWPHGHAMTVFMVGNG